MAGEHLQSKYERLLEIYMQQSDFKPVVPAGLARPWVGICMTRLPIHHKMHTMEGVTDGYSPRSRDLYETNAFVGKPCLLTSFDLETGGFTFATEERYNNYLDKRWNDGRWASVPCRFCAHISSPNKCQDFI